MKRILNGLLSILIILGCSAGVLIANPQVFGGGVYADVAVINYQSKNGATKGDALIKINSKMTGVGCASGKAGYSGVYDKTIIVETDMGKYKFYLNNDINCPSFIGILKSEVEENDKTFEPKIEDCKKPVSTLKYVCGTIKKDDISYTPITTVEDGDSGSTSGSGEDIPTPRPSETLSGNIIDCHTYEGQEGGGVVCILKIVLNVMTFGIGVLAVIGIVLAGIQYITSQGDPGKMAKAKNRIIQVVIGLVIYAVMYAALYFLVPGFNTDMLGRKTDYSIDERSNIGVISSRTD